MSLCRRPHRSGLTHRDIKPANLFLCRLGVQHDFVKLLDFGLVKSFDSDASSDEVSQSLTMEGFTTGTPAFMAPEMVLGDTVPEPRTDIYMLGCVGYWLLTGQLVFEASTPMGVATRHVTEPPVPVSERAELVVPPALEAVIMACLAKNIDERPRSAATLAEQLQAVPFDHPWTNARAASWWASHRPS